MLCDQFGEVEETWSSLLNPNRDVGPTHIHGITASDVIEAPAFAEVAGEVLALLRGRVLVAHNLNFDWSFLEAEFARASLPIPLDPTLGVCTMTWAARFLPGAGRSLRDCCACGGISLVNWHSALDDATATAGLLRYFLEHGGTPPPWAPCLIAATSLEWPTAPSRTSSAPRPRRAPHAAPPEPDYIGRLVDFMPRVDAEDLSDPYLAVLDQALADRYISADESAALRALADYLKLPPTRVEELHHEYLQALARIALGDGHLSDDELDDLTRVAELLALPVGSVPGALDAAAATVDQPETSQLPIQPGQKIVFTGDMGEPRELWMQRAADHGFVPHPGVTKDVALVVAADPASLSGKAKKARGYNIPIISIADFRTALGYRPPDTSTARRQTANWSGGEREFARTLRETEG